jgi:hypothetical protein
VNFDYILRSFGHRSMGEARKTIDNFTALIAGEEDSCEMKA